MPLDQYSVPDQYSLSNQGYSYARNALDELLNQVNLFLSYFIKLMNIIKLLIQ